MAPTPFARRLAQQHLKLGGKAWPAGTLAAEVAKYDSETILYAVGCAVFGFIDVPVTLTDPDNKQALWKEWSTRDIHPVITACSDLRYPWMGGTTNSISIMRGFGTMAKYRAAAKSTYPKHQKVYEDVYQLLKGAASALPKNIYDTSPHYVEEDLDKMRPSIEEALAGAESSDDWGTLAAQFFNDHPMFAMIIAKNAAHRALNDRVRIPIKGPALEDVLVFTKRTLIDNLLENQRASVLTNAHLIAGANIGELLPGKRPDESVTFMQIIRKLTETVVQVHFDAEQKILSSGYISRDLWRTHLLDLSQA